MTPEDADKAQAWLGMDGATAWHLIDRHAEDWHEIGELMNAWLRANVIEERAARARAGIVRLMTPNDRVEGRDAALSRRVPSHDGLGG